MSIETRLIPVDAYRDDQGQPTCCTHWGTERCKFVATRRLGTVEVCTILGRDLQRSQATTLLVPDVMCPVWN
jgi:hypothetical protein